MKRTRSIILAAILLLSTMVVFAGTAAGQGHHTHTIFGTITDANNAYCDGCTVEITTSDGSTVGCCTTDNMGDYTVQVKCECGGSGDITYTVYCGQCMGACQCEIGTCQCSKSGGVTAGCSGQCTCCGNPIPEFTTIAIPIVAILGLVAFYRRKWKK